ncbi:hypothetical protein ACIRON_24325 [Nocardioides sp. NPDC101246]|uniref:hypothetical protein n=1 Tax=Nocardioides sp. NPDC101246 TaxID=3364336 RepID=UPI0038070265
MSSKVLGGLRRVVGVALLAGAFVVAGAGLASADSEPIKAPHHGPASPMTISGAIAGNDAALTVTTDGASVVASGRAHLEFPVDQADGGVVHHDRDTGSPLGRGVGRGVGLDSDRLGLSGGATGDSSSVDVVGTGRIGTERRYYIQDGS